tara:strand:- start:160 stop:1539 length:1380 start_codon:yes stop_codon:yes gene_type:complete
MGGYNLDPIILREYDIRGVVDKTLTVDGALAIGRSFGTIVVENGGRTVCVGYDGRLSSPSLERAVVKGLLACGLSVVCLGLGPTPMLYFGVKTLPADAGIMISGSHNPPEYNGFKMTLNALPFFGEDISRLGEIAAMGAYADGVGRETKVFLQSQYVARIAADYSGRRPLRVAWDAGNGSAGEVMRDLCSLLPGQHILINEEIDGTFPSHHPDPTVPDCLKQLQGVVRSEKCDFGMAFDGDGDRVGVVDGKGRIIWGDQLLILLASDVLKENPGSTIIADVKASQALFDMVGQMGGKPLMWRTGHSLIKAKMLETGAPLAGEMSGHIFFADKYYGYDDGLYAAVRLLNYVSHQSKSLIEIRDSLPQPVNTPELRLPCGANRKFEVVKEVLERLQAKGAEIIDIDGLRVKTADGWWLLRASNTEDMLVARCEAKEKEGLNRLHGTLAAELLASGIELPKF